MKSVFHAFVAVLFTMVAFNSTAQQVNYTVEYDDPRIDPFVIVNLELFQLDAGFRNLDGMSFNSGVWGIVQPVPQIGATFSYDRAWFTLGRLGFADYPTHQELNLGGYFIFSRGLKTRPQKVTLDMQTGESTYSTNVSGDRVQSRTDVETYIMVNSQVYRQVGVRGGLYRKVGPYLVDDALNIDDLNFPYEHASLTSTGLYAGIMLRKMTNLFINTDTYGRCFNSGGRDLYLDVMLIPGNKFMDLDVAEGEESVEITEEVKAQTDYGTLGFRLGWMVYQMEKKSRTGKKFGLAGSFEGGYTPWQGWFVNGGIGITLVKATRPANI